ncbi:MAG: glycoside hydrolase 15-related protein [Actinomycetia bacterium]|nr:glycoside hydrolase 15-related protein [Actinomycetes bacterium]
MTRKVRRVSVLLIAASLAATCGARQPGTLPDWASPGLIGGGGWPYASQAVDPETAAGATYLPRSSVIELSDGRAFLIPFGGGAAVAMPRDDPQVATAVRNDSAWLASGTVPGRTDTERDMAARALLDLRLLTRPNGASTASWYGAWNYVWPRDAAFSAAAFTVTGHPAEARRILQFLARIQNKRGLWAARYNADGTAVSDGRGVQLDGLGWALWATWLSHQADPPGTAEPTELWTMVRRAADRMSRSLGADGLPPRSSDYFERNPDTEQDPHRPTLGVVAPILTGLRVATALAAERGATVEAQRWQSAARRVSAAIVREFKPYGYPRSPVPRGDMDAAVTFLAPPFAPPDPAVDAAVLTAEKRLALPDGGVLPGEHWQGNRTEAWTPETAMFALAAAASGRADEATGRLGWLADHRTSLGVLPEKVDRQGRPSSVAPLGWTASLVLLTFQALDHKLPTPGP